MIQIVFTALLVYMECNIKQLYFMDNLKTVFRAIFIISLAEATTLKLDKCCTDGKLKQYL